MDTLNAFAMNEAAIAAGSKGKVFDWIKAACIIKHRKPMFASAGLSHDWEWTGGSIFADGKPVPAEETYTYLASNWATPELKIDGEVIDCWIVRDGNPHGWHEGTYWPPEALAILDGE